MRAPVGWMLERVHGETVVPRLAACNLERGAAVGGCSGRRTAVWRSCRSGPLRGRSGPLRPHRLELLDAVIGDQALILFRADAVHRRPALFVEVDAPAVTLAEVGRTQAGPTHAEVCLPLLGPLVPCAAMALGDHREYDVVGRVLVRELIYHAVQH